MTNHRSQHLRLLSLDGGGIRGLSELIIIEELMERIKWNERLPKVPIPADYFDLIGGTSTGGIIALLLGRLRLSATEAIEAYENLTSTVFSERKRKGQDGIFKASNLEKAIKGVVGARLHGRADALMYEPGDSHTCRAFVCALGTPNVTHSTGPTLFRTYDVAKNKEYNCTIWEAARATSAAPRFFKRIKIGSPGSAIDYVDAAIGHNNPVKEVIAEALRVFGPDRAVSCLVSIGTGQKGTTSYDKPGSFERLLPLELIDALKKISTDTDGVAHEISEKYHKTGIYYRLSVDQGMDDVSLDEWKRLGEVRAHTKNYLKKAEVDSGVDELVAALTSRSNTIYDLKHLTGGVHPPSHTLFDNVPRRAVARFVTRTEVQDELDTWFQNQSPHQIFVLQGMGGSGKTQLAFRCCQKAREIGFTATLWINASSSSTVIQSYRSILNHISPGYETSNSEGEAVLQAHNVIERWTGRWLIVFDNYDNPGAFTSRTIREYIPVGKGGRVLFTSRHEDSSRLGHCINLSRMTEDESVELLLQRPASTLKERSEGMEVATTLGYLALALDQAGAYICSRELPLNQFVEHYKRRKRIVLEEIPDEWEYRRKRDDSDIEQCLSAFTTWEMSLDMIKGSPKEREQKVHFLTLAAFLNPQYISERYFRAYSTIDDTDWIDFLMNSKKWDSDKFGDLLAEFRRLSLLQVLDRRENEQAFSIHPLICDWMKFRNGVEAPSRITELTGMLATFLEAHNSNDLPLEVNQETTRHIDAWVEANENILQDSYKAVLTMPRKSIGLFAELYKDQGRYKEAERLYQRALEEWEEKLGPKHLETLRTVRSLARVYRDQGRYEEAKQLYQRALEGLEEKLGSKHPETLRTTYNLALVYRDQGRYKEAEQLYQRALEGLEEKLGPKHPETLRTTYNLALVYWNQVRYEEAKQLYQRALKGWEEKLGPKHPETLRITYNLALVYQDQGRYEEAEKLDQRALEGLEEKLGPKHPETLRITNNLAVVYWNQGRYKEAEQLYQRALEGLEEKLGPKHPETLRTTYNLAIVYQDQGRYEEAEKLDQRALEGLEEKLGPKHPETLRITNNLAIVYRDQGRYEEAEQLSRRALVGKEKRLGPKHPETLETVGNLALVCRGQGRYEEAEQLAQRALTGNEENLGAKHPDTLKIVDNLALVRRDQSRYEEAEQLSRRALAGKEEKLGVKHPETLKTVYNLARVCVNQSRYEEAEQLYRRALAGREEKLGAKHPDTLRTVHGLANVYRCQGRYEDAEQLYRP